MTDYVGELKNILPSNVAILVVVTRILLLSYVETYHECQIGIALSAEQRTRFRTYIPQSSVVEVNCTAERSQILVWSINLPNQTSLLQFSFETSIDMLNSQGIHELDTIDSGMVKIIRLLINNTRGKNGTLVQCENIAMGIVLAQTTLVIVHPTPLNLSGTGNNFQAVMLSWIPSLTLPTVEDTMSLYETYILTVMSNHTRPQIFPQIEPDYIYNAPKGAPPCELYNFSVTATYVGTMATYTGAGCNVHSKVSNIMLPSLPDIGRMESSVVYVLEKRSTMGFKLQVYFMPATYCESYPVTSYTLEVEGLSTVYKSETNVTSSKSNISIDSLLDDNVYNFSIAVSNSVVTLSTSETKFYTTDVQIVRAVPLDGDNSVMLQCVFVTGSDAVGCLVELQMVGEGGNTSIRLTREGMHNCAVKIVNLTDSSTYINEILGYDIESNGSVGTLPVPGELVWNVSQLNCSTVHTEEDATSRVIVIVAPTVAALVMVLVTISLIMIFYYNFRRSHPHTKRVARPSIKPLVDTFSPPSPVTAEVKSESSKSEQNVELYDLQKKKADYRTHMHGDGIDCNYYCTTQHRHQSPHRDVNENTGYAELGDSKEHFYHILECHKTPLGIDSEVILPDPDAPELPPPFKEESPVPPPVYHDISDLPGRGVSVRQNEYTNHTPASK